MTDIESHVGEGMRQGEPAPTRVKSVFRILGEYVILVVVAIILSFGIRATVAEVRVVPTPSMVPTINVYNRLLTLKFIYYFSDPQRGDIVVFNPPESLRKKYKDPFVKRTIGLPGDTVEVKGDKTFVNGKEYVVPAADTPDYPYPPTRIPARGDVIALKEGKVYLNGRPSGIQQRDIPADVYDAVMRGEAVKLKENYYFMLGDNRKSSYDSHAWGFVPREDVIAKAVVVFWPPRDAKVL